MRSVPVSPSRRDRSRLKSGYFVLTALGTLGSQYYFNYLFFLLRDQFGFGDRQNLWVSALHGGIYIVAAVQCGRFAERRGYHLSLVVGFTGVLLSVAAGLAAGSVAVILGLLAVYSVVLLFIWPALEALVIEHEPAARVPHMIGVYNCTWSASAALAYFTGGPLYDWLGARAVFGVPAVLFLAGLGLSVALSWRSGRWRGESVAGEQAPASSSSSRGRPASGVKPETFLRLAWMANPLSYVAIYTLLAVVPGLAARFGLSATEAGIFCSVWFFGRLAAFVGLWRWTAWHYRFGWLAAGYLVLLTSFAVILLAPVLWAVVVAQLLFGLSAGLIYSSSLFYAMDVGEAKAEHGGWHEAMIGVGICAGPAVGAVTLQLFPAAPHAGVWAVTVVLAGGFGAMLRVWRAGGLGGGAHTSPTGR